VRENPPERAAHILGIKIRVAQDVNDLLHRQQPSRPSHDDDLDAFQDGIDILH
jgi:hypothetical protein